MPVQMPFHAGGITLRIAEPAWEAVRRSAALVQREAQGDAPVYGVNTGFGKLASVRIAAEDLATLQRNIVLSHAAGVGDPLAREEVRAMMLIRANGLAKGFSGSVEKVGSDLRDFAASFRDSKELRNVFENPSVAAKHRQLRRRSHRLHHCHL